MKGKMMLTYLIMWKKVQKTIKIKGVAHKAVRPESLRE